MPSPFPGMDPYLEEDLWTSVHADLIGEIARQLAPQLQPKYVARTERRHVVEAPDEIAVAEVTRPDVAVKEQRPHDVGPQRSTAVLAGPLQLETVVPRTRRANQRSINIFDVAERRLVAAIELLSPTNKRGEG